MINISSPANPTIKWLVQLQKQSAARKQHGCFVTEGYRETLMAVKAGHKPQMLFVCPEIAGDIHGWEADQTFEVSKKVYEKMAYRPATEGIMAVFSAFSRNLQSLVLPENPMLVILESVEKPGNLGAVLRTADGCGADALLVCDPHTDMFNPNVLRAGLGCFFSVQWALCSNEDCRDWLEKKGIHIFTARVGESIPYTKADFTGPTAVVLGREDTGLSTFWTGKNIQPIHIPMRGLADSLNVSVSAAVIMYEANRQRSL